MDEPVKSFPISKYLQGVKRLLTEKIPPVWVHGVISQLVVRDRMCYLTLSEYSDSDVRPVASLNLYIYTTELDRLNEKLAALPNPFSFAAELRVSLLLQADFYVPQGKFQAKVLDIDPVHTLGEMALTRQMILRRLRSENLLERNRTLEMPVLPVKVGLVTAQGSAAYHDFTTTLASSGFCFEVVPAFARMQGNETESTVLTAMGVLAQIGDLDVICIVRGGGSKNDLNYFDSEALCRAVALARVPVLTGIGHEIDQSLVDLVAWKSCITPTDCAKFLVEQVSYSWTQAEQKVQRIALLARQRLEHEQMRFRNLVQGFARRLPGRLARERERLVRNSRDLRRNAEQRFLRENQELRRNQIGLRQGVMKILSLENLRLLPWPGRLKQATAMHIQKNSMKLELALERIKANDPIRVVKRGYSITTDAQGKVLRNASQAEEGAELVSKFAWGEVRSRITAKSAEILS